MKKIKTFVIHASFGQGHKQAALPISSYLDTGCYDLLDFTWPFLKKIQASFYLYITQNTPFLWRFLFNISQYRAIEKIIKITNYLTYYSLIKHLRKLKPDLVITTHFFPPQIIKNIQSELNFQLISVVTDIKPHPQWASPNVDKFFVATPATKKWLIDLGINKHKIIDGYVSIREGFLKKDCQLDLHKKFNLDKTKKTILFMSLKKDSFSFFKQNLKTLQEKFNLIIIYGKNKKIKKVLDAGKPKNTAYFSFYKEMWELVSVSSVIVAKPGGLTTFEGGYKKKFFIFTHFIPGQEEENMNFLKRHNVAKLAFNSNKLAKTIDEFFENEDKIPSQYPLEFKDIRKPLQQIIETYASDS